MHVDAVERRRRSALDHVAPAGAAFPARVHHQERTRERLVDHGAVLRTAVEVDGPGSGDLSYR